MVSFLANSGSNGMRFVSARCWSIVPLAALVAACNGGGDSGDLPGSDNVRPACVSVEECDDGDDCSIDRCVAGHCENVARDCDDDNACTTDSCVAGACSNVATLGCCTQDSGCDDGDFCTPDRCVDRKCRSDAPVDNCCNVDESCDDGDDCTRDTCVLHKCAAAPDPKAGCCKEAKDCQDSNVTTTDSCVDGKCQHVKNGTCQLDSDCGSPDPCEAGSCTSGITCTYTRLPDCCATEADCPVVACATPTCTDLQCGQAVTAGCCVKDPDCNDACRVCTIPGGETEGTCSLKTTGDCCVTTLLTTAFDDLTGFTVKGLDPAVYDVTPTWVIDTNRYKSAPSSLYFGDPAIHKYEYNHAKPVGGRAVTGMLNLGTTLEPVLTFQLWKDTDVTPSTDVLSVVVVVAGKADRVAWSTASQSIASTKNVWMPVTVSLAAYQAEPVQLAFQFDTGPDPWTSSYEGTYIDDVKIAGRCP